MALVSAQVLSSRNLSNPEGSIPIFETQPNYTQYKLKNATLQEWSQNVSATGELKLRLPAVTGGQGHRLFAFYQHLTLHKNYPSTTNASDSIFDNGSYVVDHFSARGAQTVTRFWEKHILKDEIKPLLATVGNYGEF